MDSAGGAEAPKAPPPKSATAKCLYCTVPDRVKYSTVLADEYRKVTEKINNQVGITRNSAASLCRGFPWHWIFWKVAVFRDFKKR